MRRTPLAGDSSADRAAEAAADLAVQAFELLTALHASALRWFLDGWPAFSGVRSVEPKSLPVLRWLPRVRDAAPPFSAPFIGALAATASRLAWQRSYTTPEVSRAFLENYGWTEFVGLTGPTAGDHLACGALLLGPRLTYPPHRHEAEEIYVPLAGTAAWKRADESWREWPPGTVIHHARYEPHAMQTGESPLLALYLWRSNNLGQKSRIDPPSRAR